MIFLFVKDMKTLKTMSSSRELCENHPFAFWSTQQMLMSFSYLVTLQVSFICLVWLDLIHKLSNQKCKLNYYKLNKSAFCENFLKCNKQLFDIYWSNALYLNQKPLSQQNAFDSKHFSLSSEEIFKARTF